jgi:hypothetical protein
VPVDFKGDLEFHLPEATRSLLLGNLPHLALKAAFNAWETPDCGRGCKGGAGPWFDSDLDADYDRDSLRHARRISARLVLFQEETHDWHVLRLQLERVLSQAFIEAIGCKVEVGTLQCIRLQAYFNMTFPGLL